MARCWSAVGKDQGRLRMLVPHFWQLSGDCFPPGYGEQTLLGSGAATGQTGPAPWAWISSASLLCHDFSALMSSSLQQQPKSNSVLQTRGSCCPASAFWIMSYQQSEAQSNSKYPKKRCQPWANCWAAELVCVGSCKTPQGKPEADAGQAGQAAGVRMWQNKRQRLQSLMHLPFWRGLKWKMSKWPVEIITQVRAEELSLMKVIAAEAMWGKGKAQLSPSWILTWESPKLQQRFSQASLIYFFFLNGSH